MSLDKLMGDRFIKVGLNISYYRKLKGLTQAELAATINKSRSFIGSIEAPNIYETLSLTTLFLIADALQIPAYKLLEFRD